MKAAAPKQGRGTHALFSGHETFPLRQMWLKKLFEQSEDGGIRKSFFADDRAIADFGVGKNMVSSIRHWALATGVMYDDGNEFRISRLAEEILKDGGLDPYAESPTTAWLVHWQLAGHRYRSTTWYWLFNHVTTPTFTRQDLEEPLSRYAREISPNHRLSAATLSRDLDTCLRSYAPRAARGTPEDYAEPLLGELGLLHEVHKGVYAFRRSSQSSLHDGLFAYALVDFWNRTAKEQSSLAFETIAYAEASPGRVFKLDEASVAQRLINISELTNHKIQWSDSAGIHQIYRNHISSDDMFDMIEIAYE